MKNHDLTLFQKQVDSLIQSFGGYWPPLSMLAAVTEELGELAREINAFEGFKPKKQNNTMQENDVEKIEEELGDLLFGLICIANVFEVDLSQAFMQIFQKYKTRDSKRYEN